MTNCRGWLVVLICLQELTHPALAMELRPDAIIVGAGVTWAADAERFTRGEFAARWFLAPRGAGESPGRVAVGLEFSLGALSVGNETAFISAFGPFTRVRLGRLPWFGEFGVKATGVTQHHFGATDIGGPFQVTSFVGGGVELGRRWELHYRFQHMSNAHVYRANPGVNEHLLGVGYRF